MATTIDQQVALDESLVPSTKRLRIVRSNFRLPSDIQSKESTLQVVYDVLRNSPLFRTFQVTTDVPEIYMHEFWATAKLHHNSIHFKIDTKKGSDEEDTETGKGGDEVRESEGESEEEETRQEEEESFDLIPRTPKESEEESNNEEDQDLRLSEEARIQEEEDTDELYRDVNINQGRCLQVTQNVEDTHVTLTPVNPYGPQESSSMSSFVSSMLNPISDVEVESIFTTASSLIVSLQTPTPIMTPSTIATITTSSEAPIPPPTIPSIILENLPTFNSAFRIKERLRSLETSFSEYRQTNPFADAVYAIPGIVQQFMTQQMMKAIREAVQIQTDRL
nr:hypothetical protein [Tanacetum cinerariifolium]